MQKNNYNYDDPDYKYTDKTTGVLRNLLEITDCKKLATIEYEETANKTNVIRTKAPRITSIKDIQYIHKQLFGDIYAWAGQLREINIQKEDSRKPDQFCRTEQFAQATKSLNLLISKYKSFDPKNKIKLATILADILDELNYFHPFREGNGRTQRLVIELLAKEKGYELNLNPPNNQEIFKTYMDGTINRDIRTLKTLIEKQLKPYTTQQKQIEFGSLPDPTSLFQSKKETPTDISKTK